MPQVSIGSDLDGCEFVEGKPLAVAGPVYLKASSLLGCGIVFQDE